MGRTMLGGLISKLDSWIGIAASTALEQALLRERFIALRQQLPWLYGIIFANLAGLYVSLIEVMPISHIPPGIFLALIVFRIIHWIRMGDLPATHSCMEAEMRRTFLVACAFCICFCGWCISLFWTSFDHRLDVVMFASLAAVGSCYALTRFPAAARVPLILIALPLGVVMSLGNRTHAAMGLSLFLLVFLTLRLLRLQDHAFVRLVQSRFLIEAEKQRALDAERLAIEEQSRVGRIANTDQLTGLANRRGFLAFLEQLSGAGWNQALILFDLDGFKPINDTFGHPTGDAMLVEVSRRLQSINVTGTIARLGGDEFAMLCDCQSDEEAVAIAQQAIAAIDQPFVIGVRKMMISACAGVSFQVADELADAMLRADVALYGAKREGRGKIALFSESMQQEFQRRTSIELALREPGLAAGIDLAFQPIFCLDRTRLRSFEALARWRHSELGWIPPSEFIPITEQISLLEEMSNALLRRAANAALHWPDEVLLSFNLSAVQLCTPGSAAKLLRIVHEEGLDSRRLQIEVTETALLADFEVARQNLSQLRASGVGIVLDDFGAGYSSISYLREMTFDTVKLDGSLVSAATANDKGLSLLRGVLALCKAMGQECVAEHIENEFQLALLRGLGCRYGQGYLLSPPLDEAGAKRMAWGCDGNASRSSAA